MSKKKVIRVLDVNLTPEKYPMLYMQAQANPKQVEATIKFMAESQYDNNPTMYGMAMNILEIDLQHQHVANE